MNKLIVDSETCIGCGLCVSQNEEYFEFNDEGLSTAAKEEVNEEDLKDVQNIAESCPVNAISVEEKAE